MVKSAAGEVPVFVNTGVRAENVAAQLEIADGAIVGTYFKADGVFENRAQRIAGRGVDRARRGRSVTNWPETAPSRGHNRDMATWKDVARIVASLPETSGSRRLETGGCARS